MSHRGRYAVAWSLACILSSSALASAQEPDPFASEPEDTPPAEGESPEAEPADAAEDGEYPQAYTARPQTLPQGTLRGDLSVNLFKPAFGGGSDPDVMSVLQLGAGYGVLDDLEVGISSERLGMRRVHATGLIPVVMSPDADFGLITPYGRYRFFDTDIVQMSADLVIWIPTASGEGLLFPDFVFSLGLPIRITPIDNLAIDTGVEGQFRFYDGEFVDLYEIPFRTSYNITPLLYVEGLPVLGVGQEFVPGIVDGSYYGYFGLGVGAGASIDLGSLGIVDAGAQFELPFLATFGSDALDTSEPEAWIVTLVGRWYVDVL